MYEIKVNLIKEGPVKIKLKHRLRAMLQGYLY